VPEQVLVAHIEEVEHEGWHAEDAWIISKENYLKCVQQSYVLLLLG
jgi:hypothetical protein